MAIVLFGEKEILIAADEFLIYCPCCERHSWADILVVSHYFHFYYMPFFPINKDSNIVCKTCGMRRYDVSFNHKLVANYNEIKNLYRHPWFTYIGLSIIIAVVCTIIIANL